MITRDDLYKWVATVARLLPSARFESGPSIRDGKTRIEVHMGDLCATYIVEDELPLTVFNDLGIPCVVAEALERIPCVGDWVRHTVGARSTDLRVERVEADLVLFHDQSYAKRAEWNGAFEPLRWVDEKLVPRESG